MGLQDLNERIHHRDFKSDRDMKTVYDPGATHRDGEGGVGFDAEHWDESQIPIRKTMLRRFVEFSGRHWKWYVGGIVVLIVGAFVVNFSALRSMLFANERVTVSITGPANVASGAVVSFTVHWDNRNILAAKNAEMEVIFPEAFRLEKAVGLSVQGNSAKASVGDIGRNGSGEMTFSGKFYGSKGSLSYLKTNLRFAPAGLSSVFETGNQVGVTIASSPLFLESSAPLEAADGNDVDYVIRYQNDSDLEYSNIRLVAEYPDGFHLVLATPNPTEGMGTWRIGNLLPGASGEVRIHGTLNGRKDEGKVLRASLGVLQGDGTFVAYEQQERSTRMIASPLSISQTVNGQTGLTASPGDLLKYDLNYVNSGTLSLRDVIITVQLDTTQIDMARLALGYQGSFDMARGMITWTAADFPGLAHLGPNEGGTLTFSVPIKSDIATDANAGKRLSIRTVAKIDSPDVPTPTGANKVIASNALDVLVSSVVNFQTFGFYTDTAIPNTGPIPPKVGQETTYMLRFSVKNYLNDLSGVKVSINLPTGVRYTGKFLPENASVNYNDRTGQLIWDIGNLPATELGSRDFSMQVSIVPAPNQVNRSPNILLSAMLEGKDSFTGKGVRIERAEKTTQLIEDKGIPIEGYNVVP
ncbi:MAG: hypothetical protein HGA31_00490 [Candidatus Moranbacteria bacterium]|nr:hypothetical protein [Candidatus Moranbacteria bacterium]